MKQASKEELLTFAKKAKEGKGYLIQLHYPFHLPGKTNARELMFFAGLELVQQWERELNKSKDRQLQREISAERGSAVVVFRTFLELVKGGLSVPGQTQSNLVKLNPTQSNRIQPNAKTHPDGPIYEYCNPDPALSWFQAGGCAAAATHGGAAVPPPPDGNALSGRRCGRF